MEELEPLVRAPQDDVDQDRRKSLIARVKEPVARRWVLGAGAGMGTALAIGAVPSAASGASVIGALPRRTGRAEVSLDGGWRFHRGDPAEAEGSAFVDRHWRKLDVPHDWRIEDLPGADTKDLGRTSADPSNYGYVVPGQNDEEPPARIGPFDKNADPTPDQELDLPGVGHLVVPGGRGQGYTVGDVAWYRRHFTMGELLGQRYDAEAGQRVEVRFDGINGRAQIWLNGTQVGTHAHGYTSFAVDLTEHISEDGPNVLAVRVDNRGKTSRWYSGSGIFRHTWLTVAGTISIPLWGLTVTTPVVDERRSVAHVKTEVRSTSPSTHVRVRATVLDKRGRKVATRTSEPQDLAGGATQTFAVDLSIHDAALWSPTSPKLYRVRSEVIVDGRVVDTMTDSFGIRSLRWDGTDGFVLNGEPLNLRGGNIHHDHGPLGAAALDRAEERTIERLLEAGFNAIRTAHNPPSPHLLKVCDRLGMLVWDEFSDMWDVAKLPEDYSNHFVDSWQRDLSDMIKRDRNHPSVIIWSLGNEIADANEYGPRMKALVRDLDATRPITIGATDRTTLKYPDVLDVHYGNRVSLFTGTSLPNGVFAVHETAPEKALTQSESYAFSIYDDFRLAEDNAWMAGSFVWTAWDHIGESALGAPTYATDSTAAATAALRTAGGQVGYPWFNSFAGDLDLIGQRKPQNYLRQVVYGNSALEMLVERPVPDGNQQFATWFGYYDELPSWTWSVQKGHPMVVRLYTSASHVVLQLNGRSIASRAVTESDKRMVTFEVPYAPGRLTAIARHEGRVVARKTIRTTGEADGLRLTSDVKHLAADRDALAHVLVEVVDRHGRRVPDAVTRVHAKVEGSGELAGLANGNPHNVDSFKDGKHWTWHGQALAVVRPTRRAGHVILTATASGLRNAHLRLPVNGRR